MPQYHMSTLADQSPMEKAVGQRNGNSGMPPNCVDLDHV